MALSYSLSTPKLGTTSASSLIKSAQTLSNELNTYNDTLQRIQFENNPSDAQLNTYLSYLQKRVGTLQSTGTITNLTKAADLTQTIHTAIAKNTSFNIQSQSIQVLAGNATKQDKLNFIVGQFQRAQAIGDETLAQSLESQAYSLSQQIQYEAQQSASAQKTLSEANATSEKDISTVLGHALDTLNNAVAHSGMTSFNSAAADWVKANTKSLEALGVVINPGAQPNYFDLVNAVAGAQYNHLMLAAQAVAPYDPYAALNYQTEAQNLRNGSTSIKTLGGSLSLPEIQQAMQDPNMFSYNYATGKLEKNQQIGYQFINGQVAPQFSNYGSNQSQAYDKVYFINPQQVALMKQLGLNFNVTQTGSNKGGATNGVTVQLTDMSPQWLKNIVGGGGESRVFTDSNGNLTLEGASMQGNGLSYYTLSGMSGGPAGVFEHLSNGSIQFAGGDAGFNPQAASLLINKGTQQQVSLQLDSSLNPPAKISLAAPHTQALSFTSNIPKPTITIPKTTFTTSVNPTTHNPQQTANPQPTTFNPQQGSTSGTNLLQGSYNPQGSLSVLGGGSSGINLSVR